MSEVNYKLKYDALKLKFMNSVDAAFRLGYEQGAKDSQLEQLQQAQMAEQQNPENPGEGEEGQDQEQPSEDPNAIPMEGSELDQHIAELEKMVNKSELNGEDLTNLKKSFDNLKSYKQQTDFNKSMKAIKKISKAMKKPEKFVIGKLANENLNDNAKKALSLQEEIVSGIMKSWEQEEKRAFKDITSILQVEGFTKKE